MGRRDWQDDEEGDSQEWEEDLEEENSTVACPHCRAEIYEDSVRCPRCGNYITRETMHHFRKPIWMIVGALLALAGFAVYMLLDIGVE